MQIDTQQVEDQEQNQENGFRSVAIMGIYVLGMHILVQSFETIIPWYCQMQQVSFDQTIS
jgi:hypothetical protein